MQSGKVNSISKEPKSHPNISKIRPIALFVILPIAFIIIYAYSLPAFGIVRFFPEFIWYNLAIFFVINTLLFLCYVDKLLNLNLKSKQKLSQRPKLKLWERFVVRKSLDDEFLKDWHPEDATTELSYIEKISYIAVPIMIFFTVIYEINFFFPLSSQPNLIGQFIYAISSEVLQKITVILISFYLWVAVYLYFVLKSSFRFYFARTTFMAAKEKTRKVDKMSYYLRGVRAYNKFLNRILHCQLDDFKICSKLSICHSINEQELISSFNYDNELQPISYFMEITGEKDLLMQKKLSDKIKEAVLFVVAIIPLVFPILVLIFPEYSSTLREILK